MYDHKAVGFTPAFLVSVAPVTKPQRMILELSSRHQRFCYFKSVPRKCIRTDTLLVTPGITQPPLTLIEILNAEKLRDLTTT